MKIGFIGAGGIANLHAKKILNIEDVEIVAVSDIVIEKAKSFAEKYGGKPYSDYREMFDKEKLDAVWICIPPFAHKDEVILAAEKGIHVFIEKPIALDLETAVKMQRAVEKHGIVSWVGYHFRQAYSVRYVKKLAEEDVIGLFLGRWWGGVVGGPEHWWRDVTKSGGQIVEQATHIYDLARFLVGDVERVYSEIDTLIHKDLPNFTIEDIAATVLRFKNGAIGVITNTSAAQKNGYHVDAEIIAKSFQAQLIGCKKSHIITPTGIMDVESLNDPYFDEDYKFIQAVRKGLKSEVPISEGVKTLEVTLAALKANKERRIITL
ncbi:MAG TPA: Gfo/Idh/MocA family oxidoreductase [Thermoproteales archaeon]|nr:Gfo/Idh/MocA family oxidoreductase [Thermoproteales archaeon]